MEIPLPVKTLNIFFSFFFQSKRTPLPPIPSGDKLSDKDTEVKEFLENCHTWNFDIIELERLTNNKCLAHLGMATLLRFQLHKTLG